MSFFELFDKWDKIFLLVLLAISAGINIFQFVMSFKRNKELPYSTLSFRNMIMTSITLLFFVPIGEGILSNYGIKLSENGLISANTKDIYFYSMTFFCLPYIILTLGDQVKWFVIIYLGTVFARSGNMNAEIAKIFKDLVILIITGTVSSEIPSPSPLELNKETVPFAENPVNENPVQGQNPENIGEHI